MTQITLVPGSSLTGRCTVPGDKSISHRAVMFGGIAEGATHIRNFLDGGDCRSTVSVMRQLGVQIEVITPTELIVHGRGIDGLEAMPLRSMSPRKVLLSSKRCRCRS